MCPSSCATTASTSPTVKKSNRQMPKSILGLSHPYVRAWHPLHRRIPGLSSSPIFRETLTTRSWSVGDCSTESVYKGSDLVFQFALEGLLAWISELVQKKGGKVKSRKKKRSSWKSFVCERSFYRLWRNAPNLFLFYLQPFISNRLGGTRLLCGECWFVS